MAARIEAYLYASGTADEVEATASLSVTEPAGSPVRVVLPSPMLLSDALTKWAALLNASSSLAGTYSIAWDSTAQAVTVSASGVASFAVELHGNLAAALGFASSSMSGALSYTGTNQALARFDDLRLSVGVVESGDAVDLREYRFARARSIAWGTVDVWKATLHVQAARAAALFGGYCAAGKVRVWQDSSNGSQASLANLAGWRDCYVLGVERLQEPHGRAWMRADVVFAVPRGS